MKFFIYCMIVVLLDFVAGCVSDSIVKSQHATQVTEVRKTPARILVADFNDEENSNNLGGAFGVWEADPSDETQFCKQFFSFDIRYERDNSFLGLIYDVECLEPAFNGFWMRLAGLNLVDYDNLEFDVKGDTDTGFTSLFKVELKNIEGDADSFYVKNITDQWQTVVIPLRVFEQISDWSDMHEFVIVFEDMKSTQLTGTIYIDNISFTKKQ